MTSVKQRVKSITDTRSATQETYKVAFWAIVALSVTIGVVSFAALGVGIIKAVLLALA